MRIIAILALLLVASDAPAQLSMMGAGQALPAAGGGGGGCAGVIDLSVGCVIPMLGG